ncbi:malto-oligosyltrehalose synthase [Geomonas sp. Red32]|uniref:malto-oligosyltrehalose synthase n=1 Tax=Geomonas sp. Red32 TaxID=2912856 RepID=UPI00202CDC21|nr:malto-oligosyltrehalose synthase [Geomonas sp. Red32]MCM0080754.1 malto-oligosyltrehalose synthase [Geomonas sp. Red32]
MDQDRLPQARIPSATYRLQFNAQFTFDDARGIVEYLHDLGISDIYASSYVAAKQGSVHGYDVVNHTLLNPEVGNEESHTALMEELRRLGMGHILDFVPNHMCIESNENVWWMDVLENGQSSPFAHFFDIDWTPVKKELTGKVLLPLLGDQYGKVLESCGLKVVFREGAFFIDVPPVQIPVEPKSYLQILGHRLDALQEQFAQDAPELLELLSINTALQHLPPHTEEDPEKRGERQREKEIIKKRLWTLCQQSPQVASFIGDNVAIFNGTKGDPASFDLLDGLLRFQVYRLSYWRVATEEINYRRFFDINALAAIRMEDPAVFEQTHALLFRLIREGKVTGVRIDHVDGLYDPLTYLRNLQKGCYLQLWLGREEEPSPGSPEEKEKVLEGWSEEYRQALEQDRCYKPFYVVVEKILLKGEQLPEQWPVQGTTGYEFMNAVNGIFVDTEKGKTFDRIYRRMTGETGEFSEVVYEKKKLIMQVSMSGEGGMLAHALNNISEEDRLTRDFTLNSLARALGEVIACFPVYRTYANSPTVRDKDVQYIEAAVARAKRKNPAVNASIFDFIRDVLLLKSPETAKEKDRMAWLAFAMKFQQITGPVTAKGLEDTAFYVYNRLVSLNEVGGMPGRFGTTREAFHGQNLERMKTFANGMIATATHDSKRGEDVRTRIDVLSELPDDWQRNLARWRRLNRAKRSVVEGQTIPDRNEEYLFYQTLLGAWPTEELDEQGFERFRGRIKEYMTKAIREAKTNTSWVSPNASYEEAVLAFADRLLTDEDSQFLREFLPFQRYVARCGMFNSLSQLLLKMTSPGVPDFYQGSELWELSLVDPDNRHPVDYSRRREILAAVKEREQEVGNGTLFRELLEQGSDGRVKLYLIYRILNYRQTRRGLFDRGDYLPLETKGAHGRHLAAFARRVGNETVLVVVPRLVATLVRGTDRAPMGEVVWGDTVVLLPEGTEGRFRNVVNDQEVEADERHGRPAIAVAKLFAEAPVALLEQQS